MEEGPQAKPPPSIVDCKFVMMAISVGNLAQGGVACFLPVLQRHWYVEGAAAAAGAPPPPPTTTTTKLPVSLSRFKHVQARCEGAEMWKSKSPQR